MKVSGLINQYILTALFISISFLHAVGSDTCLINDHCSDAIVIQNVLSDESYVCIQGCNEYASPDTLVGGCQMGDFPTVWYEINVDSVATILNIEVHSEDFMSPSISLFKAISGCDSVEQVYLTNGNMVCVIGSQGVAKAIGTYITGLTKYYVAVSSVLSIGGDFDLCVSTISDGSHCVLDRDFQLVSRSDGGPLEGPFNPAEKLRICVNVNQYTPIGNDCQWFQGIIPVFGNGWDPASFDSIGQPMNVTLNGIQMGTPDNGIYGPSRWDWFNDVGYHHDNSRLKIGDFDNNGRMDLCNSVYEIECQQQPGITGGCCANCWDDPGDILPPGWFAYGINGLCPEPGPPIRVDYGDGNSCVQLMGPWNFCFDVLTRDTPDCLGDSTKQDLTLGFYTFADGETGSWNGDESVCSYDQPLKVTLSAFCGRINRPEPEYLPTINSEDIFTYQIDDREVAYWEWNISPFHSMPHVINQGVNGAIIENQVINNSGEPIDVTIIFIGHESGSPDLIVKKVFFTVNPWTTGTQPFYDNISLDVYPNPGNNKVTIEWPLEIQGAKNISIYNAQGILVMESSVLSTGSNREEIDVSQLQKGLYFINLVTPNKIYTARLIRD